MEKNLIYRGLHPDGEPQRRQLNCNCRHLLHVILHLHLSPNYSANFLLTKDMQNTSKGKKDKTASTLCILIF